MRHAWFLPADWVAEFCSGCGRGDCTGRIGVEFCPAWQAAAARKVVLPTIGAGIHLVGYLVRRPDGEIDVEWEVIEDDRPAITASPEIAGPG